jgi:phosphoglycerol transferase MdoB-like AlkP superfamily enzyme
MENAFLTSPYGANQMCTLAGTLAKSGYNSYFFHGGEKGTMGFYDFCRAAGFDKYFSKDDYNGPSEAFGKWGVHDEEFFHFSLQQINRQPQPFADVIFSLSSHHPYAIPARFSGRFPKGSQPIHETIGYADYALRKFFGEASKQSWFQNTIFIVTADHTGPAGTGSAASGLSGYAIPLVIFDQAQQFTGVNNKPVQQTDILPTVLDILNYPFPYVCFGQSALNDGKGSLYHYSNGTYRFSEDDFLLLFDGVNPSKLFDVRADPGLSVDLSNESPKRRVLMENKLKALLQSYNSRMIHNKMCIPASP